MESTPAKVVSKGHVVLTGPITGNVTLPDGTTVDVSAPVVEVASEDQAAEVAHQIGLHWAAPENIHPGQINRDEKGKVTVEEFVYDDSHYKAHKKRKKG